MVGGGVVASAAPLQELNLTSPGRKGGRVERGQPGDPPQEVSASAMNRLSRDNHHQLVALHVYWGDNRWNYYAGQR